MSAGEGFIPPHQPFKVMLLGRHSFIFVSTDYFLSKLIGLQKSLSPRKKFASSPLAFLQLNVPLGYLIKQN